MTVLAADPADPVAAQDGPPDLPPAPAPSRKRRPGRTRPRKAPPSLPGGAAAADKPDRAPRGAARAAATKRLERELLGLYGGIGTLLFPIAPDVSKVVLEQSEPCAKSLAAWADHSPAVRKALTAATTGSVVGAVIVAHMPIVMAAAAAVGGPVPSVPSARAGQSGPPASSDYAAPPPAPGSPAGYMPPPGDDTAVPDGLRVVRATDGLV